MPTPINMPWLGKPYDPQAASESLTKQMATKQSMAESRQRVRESQAMLPGKVRGQQLTNMSQRIQNVHDIATNPLRAKQAEANIISTNLSNISKQQEHARNPLVVAQLQANVHGTEARTIEQEINNYVAESTKDATIAGLIAEGDLNVLKANEKRELFEDRVPLALFLKDVSAIAGTATDKAGLPAMPKFKNPATSRIAQIALNEAMNAIQENFNQADAQEAKTAKAMALKQRNEMFAQLHNAGLSVSIAADDPLTDPAKARAVAIAKQNHNIISANLAAAAGNIHDANGMPGLLSRTRPTIPPAAAGTGLISSMHGMHAWAAQRDWDERLRLIEESFTTPDGMFSQPKFDAYMSAQRQRAGGLPTQQLTYGGNGQWQVTAAPATSATTAQNAQVVRTGINLMNAHRQANPNQPAPPLSHFMGQARAAHSGQPTQQTPTYYTPEMDADKAGYSGKTGGKQLITYLTNMAYLTGIMADAEKKDEGVPDVDAVIETEDEDEWFASRIGKDQGAFYSRPGLNWTGFDAGFSPDADDVLADIRKRLARDFPNVNINEEEGVPTHSTPGGGRSVSGNPPAGKIYWQIHGKRIKIWQWTGSDLKEIYSTKYKPTQ